jgi:hypothetical protein
MKFNDREIKREHCVTTAEKLLWNILQELKDLREAQAEPPAPTPIEAPKAPEAAAAPEITLPPEEQPADTAPPAPVETKMRTCRFCGYTCATQSEMTKHFNREHKKKPEAK